ncbi:MAG TPA: thiamine pyrophosphate-binding protein [Vicinamibacterales bacterium]|nr:thiamine pyrophosphate-binding protein [Vicinamibacterales bacterium]
MTIADLFVTALADAGVRALFGVPGGGGNLDLLEAARRRGLRFVLSQTETAGAIMASAQAELTGAPGACLCTLGPGVASIANGAAHASLDRVPLIIVSDARGDDQAAFEHQRVDHGALLGPLVKSSCVLQADGAAEAIASAIATALSAPCGPVHLDCAPGVLASPAIQLHRPASPPAPPPAALSEAVAALLRGSRRPIVIAGLGARSATSAIRRLCALHSIPALVTYKGKGVIADDDPSFAGVFTLGEVERAIVGQADLILALGLDPVELLPRIWPYDAPVIAANDWPSTAAQVPAHATLAGPLAASVAALDAGLTQPAAWRAGDIVNARQRQRDAVCVPVSGLSPADAVDVLAAAGAASLVTIDAGAHMFPATTLWAVREPGRLLISNGLATMGYALPAAIGAALLAPDEPVVALTGDGGLLMCLGELHTVVRERLPVVVVVFADEHLSLIAIKQDRRALPRTGVGTGAVDWCRIGEAMGFSAERATDARRLERAVASALARRAPTLIEVRVDPGGYGQMIANIRG